MYGEGHTPVLKTKPLCLKSSGRRSAFLSRFWACTENACYRAPREVKEREALRQSGTYSSPDSTSGVTTRDGLLACSLARLPSSTTTTKRRNLPPKKSCSTVVTERRGNLRSLKRERGTCSCSVHDEGVEKALFSTRAPTPLPKKAGTRAESSFFFLKTARPRCFEVGDSILVEVSQLNVQRRRSKESANIFLRKKPIKGGEKSSRAIVCDRRREPVVSLFVD